MLDPRSFLRSDTGAVTVDYVVLLAAAAGLAIGTALVWEMGNRQLYRAVEIQTEETNMVTGTWAEAMRDYQPANAAMYEALVLDFRTLEDTELDMMEAFVDAYTEMAEPVASNETDNGVINDLNFALGLVYSERVRERPEDVELDMRKVETIARDLGWDTTIQASLPTEALPVTGTTPVAAGTP